MGDWSKIANPVALVADLLRLLSDFHPCFAHGNYGFAILRNRSSLQQCRTLVNVALAFFERFFSVC
jgi:hypothetical protein